MKTISLRRSLLIFLMMPFFMFNVCGKHDDIEIPELPNTDEYFTWRFSASNVNMTSPSDSVVYAKYPGNFNVMVAYNPGTSVNSYMSYYGAASTGTFSTDNVMIFANGKYYVDAQPITVTITSFGATGQPILGSYSGTLKDSTGTATFPVTGNFRVINEY